MSSKHTVKFCCDAATTTAEQHPTDACDARRQQRERGAVDDENCRRQASDGRAWAMSAHLTASHYSELWRVAIWRCRPATDAHGTALRAGPGRPLGPVGLGRRRGNARGRTNGCGDIGRRRTRQRGAAATGPKSIVERATRRVNAIERLREGAANASSAPRRTITPIDGGNVARRVGA